MSEARWWWSGQAVLFDLDGTLVDSTDSVVRAWRWVAQSLDRPYSDFEPYAHGIPASQVFDAVAPELPGSLRAELIESMLRAQADDTDDVLALPGALAALEVLPTSRWAIVTSGDRRLAQARIRAAGLPPPRVLITSEDVLLGKPDPAPYLLGASRLGADPARCLVAEDAVAGIASGRAAGMSVLHLTGVNASSNPPVADGAVGGAVDRIVDGIVAAVPALDRCRFAADRFAVTVETAA